MLELNAFVVKDSVRAVDATNICEILDPETGEVLGTVEEKIGDTFPLARWFLWKRYLPVRIEVREKPDDSLVFSICRGGYIFHSRVEILDSHDHLVGYFKKKFRPVRAHDVDAHLMVIDIYDRDDVHFAEIFGRLFGFDYHFVTPDGEAELGYVSKKSIAPAAVPELVTADPYAVELAPELAEEPFAKMLILAASLAIDRIYKQESGRTR